CEQWHKCDHRSSNDLRLGGHRGAICRDEVHQRTWSLRGESGPFLASHLRTDETLINMKIPFVDLQAQYLSIKAEIDAAISGVIAQSAFIRGPHVDEFEAAWADTLGIKHCVSCANGTDALYIAMRALALKPGDEV